MNSCGDVWATSSRDYDSILFGSPRVVRYLTISGRKFLPSKGISRPLKPELIELSTFLSCHGIIRAQLVDLAILTGTDFNKGVKGIGPKTALKLIKRHESLEALPDDLQEKLPVDLGTLRNIFLKPNVTTEYSTSQRSVDEEGLVSFLSDERGFSRERVNVALERLRRISKPGGKLDLAHWLS